MTAGGPVDNVGRKTVTDETRKENERIRIMEIKERASRLHPAISGTLRHFDYDHLPEHLQAISKPFFELAHNVAFETPNCPEVTKALNKLVEAKDWAVRAKLADDRLQT